MDTLKLPSLTSLFQSMATGQRGPSGVGALQVSAQVTSASEPERVHNQFPAKTANPVRETMQNSSTVKVIASGYIWWSTLYGIEQNTTASTNWRLLTDFFKYFFY